MRIAFILPGILTRPTGGSKVVFEYANRLLERDHSVEITIYFLTDLNSGRMSRLPLPKWFKKAVCQVRCQIHPQWFPLNHRIRRRHISSINGHVIKDGDWIFATASTTARGVYLLPESKGRKGYLIQGYETWEMSEQSLIETYRYGMENITVSHWLKEIVDRATGKEAICIPNSIDTSVFHPRNDIKREENVVAVLYHTGPYKGFSDAWRAIKLARKVIPDLRVRMFGVFDEPDNLPEWAVYTKDATQEQLASIYCASSAFICASINEGYGLTCLEAMACGCALVVSDFPGSREYVKAGCNALVAPVGSPTGLSALLCKVLSDSELRERLGAEGAITAEKFSWDTAIDKFEGVLGR